MGRKKVIAPRQRCDREGSLCPPVFPLPFAYLCRTNNDLIVGFFFQKTESILVTLCHSLIES